MTRHKDIWYIIIYIYIRREFRNRTPRERLRHTLQRLWQVSKVHRHIPVIRLARKREVFRHQMDQTIYAQSRFQVPTLVFSKTAHASQRHWWRLSTWRSGRTYSMYGSETKPSLSKIKKTACHFRMNSLLARMNLKLARPKQTQQAQVMLTFHWLCSMQCINCHVSHVCFSGSAYWLRRSQLQGRQGSWCF